jgi:hypothetical protein
MSGHCRRRCSQAANGCLVMDCQLSAEWVHSAMEFWPVQWAGRAEMQEMPPAQIASSDVGWGRSNPMDRGIFDMASWQGDDVDESWSMASRRQMEKGADPRGRSGRGSEAEGRSMVPGGFSAMGEGPGGGVGPDSNPLGPVGIPLSAAWHLPNPHGIRSRPLPDTGDHLRLIGPSARDPLRARPGNSARKNEMRGREDSAFLCVCLS